MWTFKLVEKHYIDDNTPERALIWYLVLSIVFFFEGSTRYQTFFLKFRGDPIPVPEYQSNFSHLVPVLDQENLARSFSLKIYLNVLARSQK